MPVSAQTDSAAELACTPLPLDVSQPIPAGSASARFDIRVEAYNHAGLKTSTGQIYVA
jgi:hypothetical protein